MKIIFPFLTDFPDICLCICFFVFLLLFFSCAFVRIACFPITEIKTQLLNHTVNLHWYICFAWANVLCLVHASQDRWLSVCSCPLYATLFCILYKHFATILDTPQLLTRTIFRKSIITLFSYARVLQQYRQCLRFSIIIAIDIYLHILNIPLSL